MATTIDLLVKAEEARKNYEDYTRLADSALEIFRIALSPRRISEIVGNGIFDELHLRYHYDLGVKENVYKSCDRLERGIINKVEFAKELKETKLALERIKEEKKEKMKEAEKALSDRYDEYFGSSDKKGDNTAKSVICSILSGIPEAKSVIMGFLKS